MANSEFLFTFYSDRSSISLSFGDIRMRHTDERTETTLTVTIAVLHSGGTAKKLNRSNLLLWYNVTIFNLTSNRVQKVSHGELWHCDTRLRDWAICDTLVNQFIPCTLHPLATQLTDDVLNWYYSPMSLIRFCTPQATSLGSEPSRVSCRVVSL